MMSENSLSLAGRVAVVTGAGQGIGRAHALRLAKEGVKVVVNDLGTDTAGRGSNSGRAATVVEEIRKSGGEAHANTESIASIAGCARIIQDAVDTYGRVDILINNAGNIIPDRLVDITEDAIDNQLAVNFKGTAGTCIAVSRHFKEQGSGVIVNTGSESGLGQYANAVYAASKEAVAGFTRSIARDLAPFGGRANLIRPAAITTMGMDKKIHELIRECEIGFGIKSTEHRWISRQQVPTATDRTPDHIADFVVWLCTDAAAHINGKDFSVRGSEISLNAIPFALRTIYREGRWDFDALTNKSVATNLHGHLSNEFVPKKSS
jgi:3-oxoacyl-[acyl-carrier protein] reductase